MATSAVPEATEARPPMENDENQKPFQLSGPALLSFLKAVSDVSVTPITVLNVYSAACVLTRAETPVNIVLKAAFLELPFSILPILLITRRIIRVVEQGGCSLDIGALLVLSQFIYIYVLGGVTMMTMFQESRILVASVTIALICICIKIWVCLSNHPKFLMVISSSRVDLKNGLDMISVQSITDVSNTKGVSEMGPEHSMRVNLIKISLNVCFVLYLVFYIGFMLVLAIVAENWWHALLGITVMSPIHVSGLCLICYLRDGLIRVHTMERPDGDDDLGCKLAASENV
ncbi:hypothetical protein ACQJBY_042488 [Aegilops geniculata]